MFGPINQTKRNKVTDKISFGKFIIQYNYRIVSKKKYLSLPKFFLKVNYISFQ